jgi:hypothetical protein
MPQVFPVPPTFPAPNWVSDLKLPTSPSVSNQMLGGQISTIRFSAVLVGAEMVARWEDLNSTQTAAFRTFWGLVDTWDSFTLPAGFWQTAVPAARVTLYTGASPTGFWRFKEPITIGDQGDASLTSQTIVATMVGVID